MKQSDDYDDKCDDKQKIDQPAQSIESEQTQQPQKQEDNNNSPEHIDLLLLAYSQNERKTPRFQAILLIPSPREPLTKEIFDVIEISWHEGKRRRKFIHHERGDAGVLYGGQLNRVLN